MAMHIHAIVSAAVFACLCAAISPGANGRAFADSACLEQPGPDTPQGEHWYYRSDRVKNRKCWHLGPAPTTARDAPAHRTERTRTLASTLNSMFGPLFRGLRRMFRQPMRHEAAAGEPRIVQSDATRPLTIEDIAQSQPDLPEERAEPRPAMSLTAAQRKALFEEYLKWQELRRSGGAPAPAASP